MKILGFLWCLAVQAGTNAVVIFVLHKNMSRQGFMTGNGVGFAAGILIWFGSRQIIMSIMPALENPITLFLIRTAMVAAAVFFSLAFFN